MRPSLAVACLALVMAASCTSSSSLPLEGTHWTLASLGAGGAPVAETQTEPFLVFGPEPGRMSGSGGCNRLAGTYTRKGDELTFGPIAGTRMACAQGMEVESALASALERTATARIADDRLELYDASAGLLAAFRAGSTD